MEDMNQYLVNLIEEKGKSLETPVVIEGHFGMTLANIVEFICSLSDKDQKECRNKLVYIDFKNGDVFHFLQYIAEGMAKLAEF